MVFSSPLFIFLFLPVVLAVYYLLPKRLWNGWLLLASLFFYAWGEREYTVVMLVSIAMNFGFGRWIHETLGAPRSRWILALCLACNLGMLVFFKYGDFLAGIGNAFLSSVGGPSIPPPHLHLPLGISFFTFHALSYVVDVYRRDAPYQRNFPRLALYITLFPQLIAGPILRFHEVAGQIAEREVKLSDIAAGIQRFILGFAKKILIANVLAEVVDQILASPATQLKPSAAWLVLIAYALQIYFDFSGYSDMALGLSRMLGFHFPENFNYPYISQSIQEFWRRWHISLSTWFRDYVYIPLGGNRLSVALQYRNLVMVFFLCGLWHGASWNFIIWGLFHGLFLILERTRWVSTALARLPKAARHLYALLIILVSWTFFRLETLPQAFHFLRVLFGFTHVGADQIVLSKYVNFEAQLALVAGLIGCCPWWQWCSAVLVKRRATSPGIFIGSEIFRQSGLAALFFLALMHLAAATYNPFIYFRF